MPFRYQKKNTIRSKINVPRFQSTRRKKKNSVNPSYGKKGDISGFHILIEKIDDEKDSTQYLNKMLCFGGIVPEIAHEINNPLTIISGQLQLLLSETKSSTPNYPVYVTLEEETQRVAKAVRSLVAYAQLKELKKAVVNLNDILKDVIHFIKVTRQGKDTQIIEAFDKDLSMIMAEKKQIALVCKNNL